MSLTRTDSVSPAFGRSRRDKPISEPIAVGLLLALALLGILAGYFCGVDPSTMAY